MPSQSYLMTASCLYLWAFALTLANPDVNPAVKCSVCTCKGIWRKRLLIEISIMNTSENRFAQIDRCLLYWKFVALHNLNIFFFKEQLSGNIYIKTLKPLSFLCLWWVFIELCIIFLLCGTKKKFVKSMSSSVHRGIYNKCCS